MGSYEYLTDVENGDTSYLLKAGVNFDLDDDGHTALKVSYSKGRLEEMGDDIDEMKVGLTSKLVKAPEAAGFLAMHNR